MKGELLNWKKKKKKNKETMKPENVKRDIMSNVSIFLNI